MSTSNASSLPPYLRSAPTGMHITNLLELFRSPYKAQPSSNPTQQDWGSPEGVNMVNQLFPKDPAGIEAANIFIYNRTRDIDRICPHCKRWYHVGDPVTSYASLEAFLARPAASPDLEHDEVAYEQDLSGICSKRCMNLMNGGETGVFGKDIDHVSDADWAVISENAERESGVRSIKLSAEEQEEFGGAKVVYIKR